VTMTEQLTPLQRTAPEFELGNEDRWQLGSTNYAFDANVSGC